MYENFEWNLNSFILIIRIKFTHIVKSTIVSSVVRNEISWHRLFPNLDKIGNLWWRILAIRVIVAAYPGKRSAKSCDIVSVSSRNLL